MQSLIMLSLVVALAASFANGEVAYMNGNRLLEMCESGNSGDKGFCAGYVAATMDASNTFTKSMPVEKKMPLKPITLEYQAVSECPRNCGKGGHGLGTTFNSTFICQGYW
jgi:hypothetical protein